MKKILCFFGFHKWNRNSKNIPTKIIIPSDYIDDKFEAYKYELYSGNEHKHFTYICDVCGTKEEWVEQRGGLLGYAISKIKQY